MVVYTCDICHKPMKDIDIRHINMTKVEKDKDVPVMAEIEACVYCCEKVKELIHGIML